MAERERTRVWSMLAIVTVFGALASVAGTANSAAAPGCVTNADCGCTQQNCSAPGQGGICMMPPLNSTGPSFCVCNPGYGGPNCQPLGACCGVSICAAQDGNECGAAAACTNLPAADCALFNGTFAGNGTSCASGICDPTGTPTATATQTPTVTSTPTHTPVSQGGGCTDVSQCAPGLFCSDAVCCDTACSGPLVSCNQPGQVGICAAIAAQAPAASNSGLLAMVGVLLAIGGAAMAVRRRS